MNNGEWIFVGCVTRATRVIADGWALAFSDFEEWGCKLHIQPAEKIGLSFRMETTTEDCYPEWERRSIEIETGKEPNTYIAFETIEGRDVSGPYRDGSVFNINGTKWSLVQDEL